MRQVSIEHRLVTTESSLKDLLPGAGGTVLSAAAITEFFGISTAQQSANDRQTLPAFVRMLDHQEMTALMTRLQADPRSNLMFAPKVTVFDGMSASLFSGVQR